MADLGQSEPSLPHRWPALILQYLRDFAHSQFWITAQTDKGWASRTIVGVTKEQGQKFPLFSSVSHTWHSEQSYSFLKSNKAWLEVVLYNGNQQLDIGWWMSEWLNRWINEVALMLIESQTLIIFQLTLETDQRQCLSSGVCPRGLHILAEEIDTQTNKWPYTVTHAGVQLGRWDREDRKWRMWLNLLPMWPNLQPSVGWSFPRVAGTSMTHLSLPIRHHAGNIRDHQLVQAE